MSEELPPLDEPFAWGHPDGRVVPAATMGAARRDGGAMLSSLSGYTIPLTAAPQRQPLTDAELTRMGQEARITILVDDGSGPKPVLTKEEMAFGRAVERAYRIGSGL